MTDAPDLSAAYALKDAEDARRLYAGWAATYDARFGAAHGYVGPREVARVLAARGAPEGPILDVGAGTGLVGQAVAVALPGAVIDGLDLSREMLAEAEGKGVYRRLIAADLNAPLDLPDAAYAAMTCSGTFTHGHVGPGCLPELLRCLAPGGRLVAATPPAVLDEAGFGSALAGLVASGAVLPVPFHDAPVYEGADHANAADRYLIWEMIRCG